MRQKKRDLSFLALAALLGFIVCTGCAPIEGTPISIFEEPQEDGDGYLAALDQAAEWASSQGDVTRYRVVKLNEDATSKFFDYALSGNRPQEDFDLALFSDAPCTLSADNDVGSRRLADGSLVVESVCSEDPNAEFMANLVGPGGAPTFHYRNVCLSTNPRYQLASLEGTQFAIASESALRNPGVINVLLGRGCELGSGSR